MNTTSLRYRFMLWYARQVLRIPFTVNFNKPDSDEFYAVAFAATPAAADRVRGDDLLIERLAQANAQIAALSGSRKGRRAMKLVARSAIRKEAKQ